MRVDRFDFELPPERIALRPASPRDAARLLVVRPGAEPELDDRTVSDLPGLLRAGDVLVFNDTRVIPARLAGIRVGRGEAAPAIEVTLHQRLGESSWAAFAKPARKLEVGDTVSFAERGDLCYADVLTARVEAKGEGGEVRLGFNLHGAYLDQAIAAHGEMPLPPYIASRRPADARDRDDYQTLFAEHDGAVAAPTAGLHFTPALVAALRQAGIAVERVTLHVGAGTFLPVKADDTEQHRMHEEWGEVSAPVAARLNAARAAGHRIVAVGTTSARLLETAADAAGEIRPFSGTTAMFITPGYRFRAVDALLTNFHLPRSTLFMLVAAFSGLERMQRAYAHAVAGGYRFYSYGDAGLLFSAP